MERKKALEILRNKDLLQAYVKYDATLNYAENAAAGMKGDYARSLEQRLHRVPTAEEVTESIAVAALKSTELNRPQITILSQMHMDLVGIVKDYITENKETLAARHLSLMQLEQSEYNSFFQKISLVARILPMVWHYEKQMHKKRQKAAYQMIDKSRSMIEHSRRLRQF
jgi:hypothetical protein